MLTYGWIIHHYLMDHHRFFGHLIRHQRFRVEFTIGDLDVMFHLCWFCVSFVLGVDATLFLVVSASQVWCSYCCGYHGADVLCWLAEGANRHCDQEIQTYIKNTLNCVTVVNDHTYSVCVNVSIGFGSMITPASDFLSAKTLLLWSSWAKSWFGASRRTAIGATTLCPARSQRQ